MYSQRSRGKEDMIPDDINDLIIQLVGRNACNNNVQVSADFRKVVQALRYLILQAPIMARNGDQEDKEYVENILGNVKKMLEPSDLWPYH